MIVGLAEVLTITYIGSTSGKDGVTFALLIVILLVRPQGLFGRRRVRAV